MTYWQHCTIVQGITIHAFPYHSEPQWAWQRLWWSLLHCQHDTCTVPARSVLPVAPPTRVHQRGFQSHLHSGFLCLKQATNTFKTAARYIGRNFTEILSAAFSPLFFQLLNAIIIHYFLRSFKFLTKAWNAWMKSSHKSFKMLGWQRQFWLECRWHNLHTEPPLKNKCWASTLHLYEKTSTTFTSISGVR